MKNILMLTLLLLLSNFTIKSKEIEPFYKKMEFKYVDLSILTPVNIDCNNFESFFKDEIKVKTITDTSLINDFVSLLKQLPSDSISPDTRIIVILYDNNNHRREICIDRLYIMEKNKTYSNTENLLKILNEILYKQ